MKICEKLIENSSVGTFKNFWASFDVEHNVASMLICIHQWRDVGTAGTLIEISIHLERTQQWP